MLRLEALKKTFGPTAAVADLSLEVEEGEFLTLLGPSGCGKTTTLRLVAGFESPDAGHVYVAGRDVTRVPPQRRGLGMVFQNYALFPHLSVFENVAFGLRVRRLKRADIESRVARALDRVDLSSFGERAVQELSGGQQQRVALARALAPEPRVILLDEPLSNLDAALRERTRSEMRQLLKRLRITAVFVTHDQEEAFALSDRIALLRSGRLQQLGVPEDLYHRPTNAFVASFIGRANLLRARVVGTEDGRAVTELPDHIRVRARCAGQRPEPMDRVLLMMRPESIRLLPGGAGDGIPGIVAERRFSGAVTHYTVRTRAGDLLVTDVPARVEPGARVLLRPNEDQVIAFEDDDDLPAHVPTEE